MSENDRFKPDYQAPENTGDNNNENTGANENRGTNLNQPVNQNYVNDAMNQQNQQQNQNYNPNQGGAYNQQNPLNQQINNIGNPYQQNAYLQKVPNSEAVLVLGIIAIVSSFCYGILGVIFGIISLVLASSANKMYLLNPNAYTLASYNNLKSGKVCAIIGLILGSLVLISILLFFGTIFGLAGMSAAGWH
jgi:M penetrans paralogue family 26